MAFIYSSNNIILIKTEEISDKFDIHVYVFLYEKFAYSGLKKSEIGNTNIHT